MIPIGVQQFQLRNEFKNQKMALKTFDAIKADGLDGIELDAFLLMRLPLYIRLFARAFGMNIGTSRGVKWHENIAQSGLQVFALHEDLGSIKKDPKAVAELARSYHTSNVVITGLFHYDYSSREDVEGLCQDLNAAGAALKKEGIALLYHNHNCEFRRVSSEPAFAIIASKTDPEFVNFEFDCYWCAECGADPLFWMERLGKRIKLVHLNDRGNREQGKKASIVKSTGLELGSGNYPLPLWIRKAEELGVEALLIETHDHWIHRSALESLKISAAYLRENR